MPKWRSQRRCRPHGVPSGLLRRDAGAGTVVAAGLALVLVLLLVTVALLAQGATAAARAATAADLGALAAADAARGLTAGDPCQRAAEVVNRHGAQLVSCLESDGGIVHIRVRLPTALPWPATAEARAGPPPATDASR